MVHNSMHNIDEQLYLNQIILISVLLITFLQIPYYQVHSDGPYISPDNPSLDPCVLVHMVFVPNIDNISNIDMESNTQH